MKKLLLTALVTAITTGGGTIAAKAQDELIYDNTGYDYTVNVINNEGAEIGTIGLRQGSAGVLLNVDISGLPPGGKHGFHLHQTGECGDHDAFMASGGHIATEGAVHGLLNPAGPEAGDLPNLIVDDNGNVRTELYAWGLTINYGGSGFALADDDGSAFVIHEGPDDHMTQPIGGAGSRIACGVVEGIAAMDAESETEAETDTDTDTSAESAGE